MDIVYANQISFTFSENEVFLRFATIHPTYDISGKPTESPTVSNERVVLLTKDAYEAATLYYQQGLNTEQTAALSTETLKMAKIAGIDYSTAANAMTVAVRAFKLEMTDAQG